MELREPRRKHVPPHVKAHQPFPILIESETGIPSHRSLWPLYTGIYNENCVVICNCDEMAALYNMGFFGKGSFSRGMPMHKSTVNDMPPFIYGRQWNRRKQWIGEVEYDMSKNSNCEILNHDLNPKEKYCDTESNKGNISDYMDKEKNTSESNNLEIKQGNNVVVINDSDNEEENVLINPKVTIEKESIETVKETLNLSLEEAFFLSYALGCLQVFDWTGQVLPLVKMWCIFRQAQPDFIENYVSYHYFRAKGWIVKPGYKFGGDLMLYKQGPTFYHASYVVVVESIQDNRRCENFSWNKLHGINRIAETANKEVLLCQVFWPLNLDAEEVNSPQVLTKFKVNEILLRRWIPSQEREDKE